MDMLYRIWSKALARLGSVVYGLDGREDTTWMQYD